MQTNLKRYGFYSLMDKSPGCFRCDANARIEFLNLVLVVPVTISSKWAISLLLCQLQFVCFPLLRSETRKFWWTLYFTFFVLLRTSGYMLKGFPAGVNLARSKRNLSVILRLSCASCIEHDTHTHWSVQLRPLKSQSEQNSSLPLLLRDVFELGKNAYSWLVATCDALWLTCLSVMCRRSIDTWAWAAFRVFTAGSSLPFLSSFISGLVWRFLHFLIYCLVWYSSRCLSVSELKTCRLLSFSCCHTHRVCHFNSEQTSVCSLYLYWLFLASQRAGGLLLMTLFSSIQIQHVVTPPNQR